MVKLKNLESFTMDIKDAKLLLKFKNGLGYLKITTPTEMYIYKGSDFSGIFKLYASITNNMMDTPINVNKIVKRLKKSQ